MKKLNLDEIEFLVKTLLEVAARDRVELYALRIALAEANLVSLETLAEARKIAERRYAQLIALVTERRPEDIDLAEFLKAFEGPVQ